MHSVVLGVVEYFGQQATAIREVNGDEWTFTLVIGEKRFPVLSY